MQSLRMASVRVGGWSGAGVSAGTASGIVASARRTFCVTAPRTTPAGCSGSAGAAASSSDDSSEEDAAAAAAAAAAAESAAAWIVSWT